MIVGSGKYTYELIDEWAKLPSGWSFIDVGGLAIDSQDRVHVFSRSPHSLMVFDRDGNFLYSWGEGYFKRPHGIRIHPDGTIYCADVLTHTISQFTPEGKLIRIIGNKDKPSDTGYVKKSDYFTETLDTIKRGGPPFNSPTGIAFSSSGEIYVSDGYGNARVHKFSPEGTLLFSWGEPGRAPGQFRLPHNIWIDRKDRVWIADRENSRIQIFDSEGNFITQWTDLIRPTDIFIDEENTVYVSQSGLRVSIFTIDGQLLALFGNDRRNWKEDAYKHWKTDLFVSCHAIAVDSRGDIYVGENSLTASHLSMDQYLSNNDRGSKTVRKFARK